MNREQKAAFIEDVAGRVKESDAIFAVDYRGINVPQVAELRDKLRESDASFQIVKNTLTIRALDETGNTGLKEFMAGPTAFTYVRGDIAAAAKTLSNFAKETDLLAFKGGEMNGQVISADQFQTLAKLPTRQVLYGQLVGMIASPISGVTRTLNALIAGLASQLGQIRDQGLVTGEAPAAPAAEAAPAEATAPVKEVAAEEPAAEAPAEEAPADAPADEPAAEEPASEAATEEPAAEEAPAEKTAAEEAPAEEAPADDAPAEPEADTPADAE